MIVGMLDIYFYGLLLIMVIALVGAVASSDILDKIVGFNLLLLVALKILLVFSLTIDNNKFGMVVIFFSMLVYFQSLLLLAIRYVQVKNSPHQTRRRARS
jgi:hypothetical protein